MLKMKHIFTFGKCRTLSTLNQGGGNNLTINSFGLLYCDDYASILYRNKKKLSVGQVIAQ